jgi:hypothetical protein
MDGQVIDGTLRVLLAPHRFEMDPRIGIPDENGTILGAT